MEFGIAISSGREVLFVGHERGNSKPPKAWLDEIGRWKIAIQELRAYLNDQLKEKSFGASINRFVFCFEIADFELWGKFYKETATYTLYRHKFKEIWSVGQLRWSDVKHLTAEDQFQALRDAIQAAIMRIGTKPRKPRDFDYVSFAAAIDNILARVPIERFVARPAV
jgi:hypothetical protein